VDRVDLLVPAGTAFGYLGPDGAGKTTLIRMLPGLRAATSGSVRVLGHPVPAGRSAALCGWGDGRGAAVPDADLLDPDAALGAVEPPGDDRPRSSGFQERT
jgi:ABC-type phosphate/phosphonate transport system ATPase subunit